jgi:hypothetical protein
MFKNSILHIVFGLVPLILFLLLLDPFMYWMPASSVPIVLALSVVATAMFVGLVWQEDAQDERDVYHKLIASRIGYTAGVVMLAVGSVYQALTNMVDPWLYAALVVMVLGKLAGRIYSAYQA